MSKHPKYVTASNIKQCVDIHPATLRNWAILGRLDHITTPSGKRMYNREQALELIGVQSQPKQKRRIVYARVSSSHQKGDLERQITTLTQRFPTHELIKDIGSGLNFKRKGFEKLLVGIHEGSVEEIVVTYRDRLCRFGFELFEWFLKRHEVKLVVLDTLSNQIEPTNGFNELAEDLLAITNYFVAKNNGIRAGKARKERTQHQGKEEEGHSEETHSRDAKCEIETNPSTEDDFEEMDG